MKPIALFLLSLFLSFTLFESVTAQTVTIAKRTVKYTRKKPIADHKRSFVINYAEPKGLSPAIAQKMKAQLNYFKLFDFSLSEELSEIQWLEEADFEVKHIGNGIVSIAMWIEGSGAYPDGVTKYVNLSTKIGTRITPALMFTDQTGLASLVGKKMQAAIKEALKAIREDKENDDLTEVELFGKHRFSAASLNNFFVTAEGITFVYQYNFPHVIQALEPENEYSMTWKELEPFIRRDGLLASFIR